MHRPTRRLWLAAVLLVGLAPHRAPAASRAEPLALYPGADPQPRTEHVFTYPLPEALLAARAVLEEAGFQVFPVPGSQTELYTAWKLGTQVSGGHGQATLSQGVRVQAVAVSPTETVVRFFRVTRVKDEAVMARAPRRIDPGSRFTQGARPPSDLEHFSDESDRREEREMRLGILKDQTFSYAATTTEGGDSAPVPVPGASPRGAGGWASKVKDKKIWEQETAELLEHDARFAHSGDMPTGDDLRARNERGLRDRSFEKELVRRLEQFPALEYTGGAYDVAPGRAPAGTPRLAEAYAKEGGERPFGEGKKDAPCGQTVTGFAPLSAPGTTLLVGAQTGTRELPAAVGNMACEAARAGRQVLLALPIPRDEQGALEAYVRSAGTRADEDALLARDFWRLAPRDGHSSRSMLVLLSRVRAWRAEGLSIQPVAMDARNLRDNRREAAVAELLLQQRRASPQAVLLVLGGNYHMRVEPGASWNPRFVPVGARLAKAGVTLTALDTAFARGRRWTCAFNARREPECRVYAAAPTEQSYSPPGLAPALSLFESASGAGFHGVLHVGALSPSLPAVPSREQRVAARPGSSNAGPDAEPAALSLAAALPAAGVAPRAADVEGVPLPEDEEGEALPAPVTASLDARRPPADCGEPLFGADVLYVPGGLLLLGELQGSQEAPAWVARFVCHAATRRLPVTLALEIPRTEGRRLNRFLASAGRAADRRRLLDGRFWNRPYQDGRSSGAVLALLERVRQQRQAGQPIEVLAFDTPAQGSEHDVLMAQALLAERTRQPGRLMVVLTGNTHARTVKGAEWDASFVPLGFLLRQREPRLVALDMDHGGGSAWSCKLAPGGNVQCGAYNEAAPLQLRKRFMSGAATGRTFIGAKPFVQLGKERSPEGFDGLFYVGALSPAEPASRPGAGVR